MAANVTLPPGPSEVHVSWSLGRYNAVCNTFNATAGTWAVDASVPPGTRELSGQQATGLIPQAGPRLSLQPDCASSWRRHHAVQPTQLACLHLLKMCRWAIVQLRRCWLLVHVQHSFSLTWPPVHLGAARRAPRMQAVLRRFCTDTATADSDGVNASMAPLALGSDLREGGAKARAVLAAVFESCEPLGGAKDRMRQLFHAFTALPLFTQLEDAMRCGAVGPLSRGGAWDWLQWRRVLHPASWLPAPLPAWQCSFVAPTVAAASETGLPPCITVAVTQQNAGGGGPAVVWHFRTGPPAPQPAISLPPSSGADVLPDGVVEPWLVLGEQVQCARWNESSGGWANDTSASWRGAGDALPDPAAAQASPPRNWPCPACRLPWQLKPPTWSAHAPTP